MAEASSSHETFRSEVPKIVGLDRHDFAFQNPTADSENPCSVCTYHNPVKVKQCQMCGTKLKPAKPERFHPNDTVTFKHKMRSQKSVINEELRRTENVEALQLYLYTRQHCEEVL